MLRFDIFDCDGQHVASAAETFTTGAILGLFGPGTTVRDTETDQIIWTEGLPGQPLQIGATGRMLVMDNRIKTKS